jgi:hypothetical protein
MELTPALLPTIALGGAGPHPPKPVPNNRNGRPIGEFTDLPL